MTDSPILPRPIAIEELLPLAGQTFLADCEPKAAALVLVEVIPGRERPGLTGRSFTLIFRSTPDVLLTAGMYTMKTDSFGPDVIYLERTVPPSDQAGSPDHYYQAVFN